MRTTRSRLARALVPALLLAGCASRPPDTVSKTPSKARPGDPSENTAGTDIADSGAAGASSPAAAPAVASSQENAAATPSRADPPAIVADLPISDEPIYFFPGGRARPKGSAVEASLDDEMVATWNRGGLSDAPSPGPKGKPAHAAPRVKVDVTEVRGDTSEADMQRVARLKSYWPFRICYEQGLRRMQKLHGTIRLRLTIGPSGRPSGVQQLATELGDAAVVSCVVKSAMALGLPAPSSGAPQVTLAISLWPGDDPVNVKTAPRGKNAAPVEAAALTEVLRARWNDVRACYAAGLQRHDGLWGRLALTMRITSGIVDDVGEVESHFPDAEVTECVRRAFLHAEVPAATRDLSIVYPLRFGRPPDARDTQR
jgi:hypothetical protein